MQDVASTLNAIVSSNQNGTNIDITYNEIRNSLESSNSKSSSKEEIMNINEDLSIPSDIIVLNNSERSNIISPFQVSVQQQILNPKINSSSLSILFDHIIELIVDELIKVI